MPFGGPCLPRDTAALAALARQAGASPRLWDTVLDVNAGVLAALADSITSALPPAAASASTGSGSSPDRTVEAPPAADLARMLLDEGVRTIAVIRPCSLAPCRRSAWTSSSSAPSRSAWRAPTCWSLPHPFATVPRGRWRRTVTDGDRLLAQRGSRPRERERVERAHRPDHRGASFIGSHRDGAGRSRRARAHRRRLLQRVLAQPAEARSIAPLEIQEGDLQDPGWRPAPAPGCTPSSTSPPTTAVAGTSTPARPARRTTSRWTWACSALPPEPVFPRSCSSLRVRLSQLPADRPGSGDLAARGTGRPALRPGPHVRLGEESVSSRPRAVPRTRTGLGVVSLLLGVRPAARGPTPSSR